MAEFFRHQPSIDAFKDEFFQDEDGQIYHQPMENMAPMPFSYEEFEFWVDKFESQMRIGLIVFWISVIVGFGYGYVRAGLLDDTTAMILPALSGFGIGMAFALHRGHVFRSKLAAKYAAWARTLPQ